MEDLALELKRNGFTEEAHFTVAYSPVPDDSAANGIGGVLATVHEITEKIVGERRIGALRDLSAPAEAKTAEQACTIAASALAAHAKDIPFALIYLIEPTERCARLAGATGVSLDADIAPSVIALDETAAATQWPLADALQTEGSFVIEDLANRFSHVPAVPSNDPPHTAMVIPIKSNVAHELAGFFVAAASPRLKFDAQYKSFLELAATQISAAISTARAYESERKRAEALAEIDRAKTQFFSNVSHEFRTPLTLMLGPLEDSLSSPSLPASERERLNTARRNSLRLLKLVNSLLDFSRIEAGRAQASYEPVDLAALTADLASNFRSAVERAGLNLAVDCTPFAEPVLVDRDMWEKIVLNLLSNALKFTFEGEIAVRLRQVDGHAELRVSDSGVGIPPHELPRLFERFHRIEGQRSRTYEGSGIGLALIQELVKLHRGAISAESTLDRGTTFTVIIPLGHSHLTQQIATERPAASPAVRAEAYVEEALRWLPDDKTAAYTAMPVDSANAHILLADDNADMRAYIRRLLGPHCNVQTAEDGQEALDIIREQPPDLVLADVMMPRLDGLGLVRALRTNPATVDLPVVLLSARAGEEAKIQGLDAGADDYLVKPFSGRELIARVRVNLTLARLRKHTAADLRDMKRLNHVAEQCVRTGERFNECLNEILDAAIAIAEADKGDVQLFDNERGCLKIAAQRGFEPPFLQFFEYVQPGDTSTSGRALQTFDRVMVEDVTRSEIFTDRALLNAMLRAGVRAVQSTPLVSSEGAILGMISTHFDEPHRLSPRQLRVLDLLARQAGDYLERKQDEVLRRRAEETLQRQNAQFATLLNQAPLGVYLVDAALRIRHINPTAKAVFGDIPGGAIGQGFDKIIHSVWEKNCADEIVSIFRRTLETGVSYATPKRAMLRAGGSVPEYYEWRLDRIVLPDGSFGLVCYFRDIGEQVQADATRELLLGELNHRVKNTLANVQAIAQQTIRSATDPKDFATRFSGRIQSLARVHSLLTDSTWRGADLWQLIRDQLLRGAIDETRLTARGPAVHLQPQAAVHMAVMLHELGTNSVKYGSLSAPKGSVTIDWSVAGDALHLQWIERGGPIVSVPARRGFGTTLIEQSAKSEGGCAEQLFEPEGITWKISLVLPQTDNHPAYDFAQAPSPAGPQDRAAAVQSAARLAGLRILVVEDESLIALDLVDRLEMAGADVASPVSTEEHALQVIEDDRFDCALLDANLHGQPVDGIAAALKRCNIPFVFITGYGRAGLPRSFQQAPVLSKPVGDQDLLDAITGIASQPSTVLRLKQ